MGVEPLMFECLTDVKFQKPVIVYNYPKDIKAFCMRLNDDSERVAGMDVLVPKVGELIAGEAKGKSVSMISTTDWVRQAPTE
ncbi:hypothetical protein ACE6H2_015529 [Prunus campanulata]